MAQKWPFSCDMPNFAFIKGIDLIHFLHISLMEMDFLCRKHMFLVFNGNIFFNLLYFPTTAHIVNVHRPRDEFLSKMTSSDFQFALRQKTLHAEISSCNVLMGHHNIFFDSYEIWSLTRETVTDPKVIFTRIFVKSSRHSPSL